MTAEEGTEVADVEAPARPWPQRIRAQWAAIVLTLLLIASAAVTSWLFFFRLLPDREVGDAAEQSAIQAAKDGTVALLSYSPETLDKDFAAARSKLTGDFLSYYTQFTEQIVTPAAKQKSVKTTASVVQAAVSELHPDLAVVLVFINQITQSSGLPEPSVTVSSVRVSLKKVDGAWLISSFDPV